ncbi:MAG: hypothetical protein CL877_07915 [Dehalococcoidales bacterium]|jgi:ABC-type glycerol-3-phosphate transport system substrate-binding protein|nr:hypothetical protein [Dehalococcoidales bacterium]
MLFNSILILIMRTTRRKFIKYAGAAAVSGLTAGLASYALMPSNSVADSMDSTTIGIGSFEVERYRPPDYLKFLDWLRSVSKPLSGQRIVIAMENEPFPRAMQRINSDFFNFSGILTEYELTPFLQNLSNIRLAVNTKSPTYDIFNIDGSQIATFSDDLIPPQELAELYPELTYPDFDVDGFDSIGWALSSKYPQDLIFSPYEKELNGSVVQWPQDIPIMIHFYRKDLYEKEGLEPARTWDEYYEDIKHFDNPNGGFYGAVSMAFVHPSITFEYLNHLHSFGGKIWEVADDNTLRCVMNSDEAVAALENFVRFARYSDPGSSSYSWDTVASAMANNRAANAIQFADYSSLMDNPNKSQTVGKWGYKLNPAGPAGSFTTFAGAGVGVSKYSRHPKESWLWLQWVSTTGAQVVALQDPLNNSAPNRKAVYDDPIIKQELETGKLQYLKVVKEALSTNRVGTLISHPKWPQAGAIMNSKLHETWRGYITPREAVKTIQDEIDALGPVFTF